MVAAAGTGRATRLRRRGSGVFGDSALVPERWRGSKWYGADRSVDLVGVIAAGLVGVVSGEVVGVARGEEAGMVVGVRQRRFVMPESRSARSFVPPAGQSPRAPEFLA